MGKSFGFRGAYTVSLLADLEFGSQRTLLKFCYEQQKISSQNIGIDSDFPSKFWEWMAELVTQRTDAQYDAGSNPLVKTKIDW